MVGYDGRKVVRVILCKFLEDKVRILDIFLIVREVFEYF